MLAGSAGPWKRVYLGEGVRVGGRPFTCLDPCSEDVVVVRVLAQMDADVSKTVDLAWRG